VGGSPGAKYGARSSRPWDINVEKEVLMVAMGKRRGRRRGSRLPREGMRLCGCRVED
jgi:hypothetical protein